MMKKGLYAVFLIGVTFFISSCATYNAATGRTEIQFISTGQEQGMGPEMHAQILAKNKEATNRQDWERVNRIGHGLVGAIPEKRGVKYTFKVIEDANMNAFTVPGGFVYATTGLLENASDQELAAVLAHEIGHSEARHAVKHMEAGLGYSTLMSAAYILDPKRDENKKQWQAAQVFGGTLYKLVDLGYSRKDEYEADRLSVRYMRGAGYDPRAILTFFEKLKAKQKQQDARWLVFVGSHPFIDDRMKAAEDEIIRTAQINVIPRGE